ncbi:hypothetical protein [Hymenobacter coccineus]|uniref:Lipocalin-like domain-containing protein n=1 Tax=Hymenobacter coccineus TaxID=1908235 RepID=A0A1G1TME1_9BACT|nr:hypothetical protein [Hymenobacter coccineus]OGX92048.1 hypothetical protein BEN49_17510 [Hymenobacter coccineus]
MKNSQLVARSFLASFALLLSLFVVACGNDKGKVEAVNMLYGTDSKVWKTAKETDATGDKVKQTDVQKQEELRIFSNGNYTMTSAAESVSGKYTFDQAAKTIMMTPTGATAGNQFTVETLTDDKLTLVGTSGAKLMLEKE